MYNFAIKTVFFFFSGANDTSPPLVHLIKFLDYDYGELLVENEWVLCDAEMRVATI